MGLFGITLKKIEAIPEDIFGGGNKPAPTNNSNNGVYQSPASQAAAAVHPVAVARTPVPVNPVAQPPPAPPPSYAPASGDVEGLKKALGGIGAYSQDDQARIINRASLAGLIPKNVAAATQNQILSPDVTPDRSKLGELAEAAEDVLLPGVSNLARQVGINEASKSLLTKSLNGKMDPAAVSNTLDEANAENGGIVDNVKGINPGNLANAGVEGALGLAGAVTAPEITSFAARNASKLQKAASVGKDALERIKNFDPSDIKSNPFLNEEQLAPVGQKPTPSIAPTETPQAESTLSTGAALPENTANAAHTLSGLYNEAPVQAENGNNLLNMGKGRGVRFSKAGDQLDRAINSEYTPEEQVAARDANEGVSSKLAKTPRVKALSDVMKQLDEQGYQVMDKASTAKDPLHRVQNYATRVANRVAGTGNAIQKKMSDITDLFNTKSGHSISRSVQKFVSPTGDVQYGTKTELGLDKDGLDKEGVQWKPRATSTSELNANGYNYENNYGKITNTYHSSVGRVKANLDAKTELLRDPEHYGLTKTPPARDPLRKYVPVTGVPELEGYYAPRSLASKINDTLGHPHVSSLPEQALQGVTRGAVQSIVLNLIFHGRNLMELAGLAAGKVKGIFGGAQMKKAVVETLSMSDEDQAAIDDRMHSSGVVKQTYGTDQQTIISDAADKVGLPHFNKASASVMSNLDWNIRRGLFHLITSGEHAVNDEKAAAIVNHFLGDAESSGPLARNLGLFWHYMKTRVNVVSDALMHPNENSGTIIMGAEQAAFLWAATKTFQDWTGNQHASLGHPGIFGLANIADEIAHGQGAAAATASINPVVTAVANQAYGKDLYTDQALNGPTARLKNLENTLVSPTQDTSKVADGKASVGQEALQMGLGISTPHIKGAPAIPNLKNPLANSVNLKGAKPVADEKNAAGKVIIHDPTGIAQAALFDNAKAKSLKAVAGNPEATDAINLYLDDNTGPKGVKIKKSPAQAMGAAEALSGTPDALDAMRKMQQAQPGHDPMWDLSDADLKTFLQTQGSSGSSGVKAADEIIDTKFNNGEGLTQFEARRNNYYSGNSFSSTAQPNPQSPTYPTFTGQQQSDYNTYEQSKTNWTSTQKAQYLQAHPLAADALNSVNTYFNALNKAQTGLATKSDVQLTPAQQTWYNWYNSLPKNTGARSSAIKGDQKMWNAITASLGQNDLTSLAEQGAVNQYSGVPFSQTFMKDAYNAGQFDIAPPPPSGGDFALNTAGTNNSSSGSSSSKASATLSKFIANEKADSQARDAEHSIKAVSGLRYKTKLKGSKHLATHMRGETRGKSFKPKSATLKPRQIPKIALKQSQALNTGNHAKLKT